MTPPDPLSEALVELADYLEVRLDESDVAEFEAIDKARAALAATPPAVPAPPPWDHPYESKSESMACIHCGWVGSYAHTAEFYQKWVFPALSRPAAAGIDVPVTAIGELTAYLVREVKEGIYECQVCDADVTRGPHDADCEVAIVRQWLKLPGAARLFAGSATEDET